MKRRIEPHPGRRFEILAMLDRTHPRATKDFDWSAEDLARAMRANLWTIRHTLARLRSRGLVEAELAGGENPTERRLKSGDVLKGVLPSQLLIWKITKKGLERVAYVGGHERWCLICRNDQAR